MPASKVVRWPGKPNLWAMNKTQGIPLDKAHNYSAICACGRLMFAGQYVCSRCEYMAEKAAARAMVSCMKSYYEVVWCPHDEIPARNRFPLTHFQPGLDLGTWPLGMIVRKMPDNKTWIVCGDGRAYRNPAPDLPRQRLVAANGRCRA